MELLHYYIFVAIITRFHLSTTPYLVSPEPPDRGKHFGLCYVLERSAHAQQERVKVPTFIYVFYEHSRAVSLSCVDNSN